MELIESEVVKAEDLTNKGFIPMGKLDKSGRALFMVARDEESPSRHEIYTLSGIEYPDGVTRYRRFFGELRKS